jgi:hypothetical protein
MWGDAGKRNIYEVEEPSQWSDDDGVVRDTAERADGTACGLEGEVDIYEGQRE